MAYTWAVIETKMAHMVNALYARTVAEGDANLGAASALSPSIYQSPGDPQTFIRMAGIDAYMDLATAMCHWVKCPLRQRFYTFQGILADGDELPESIGPHGEVRTTTGGYTLKPCAYSKIEAYRANVARYLGTHRYYAKVGNRIHHTIIGGTVEIETASVTRPVLAIYDANSNVDMPDNLVNLHACLGLRFLPLRAGYNIPLAQQFDKYASDYFAVLSQGGTDAPYLLEFGTGV